MRGIKGSSQVIVEVTYSIAKSNQGKNCLLSVSLCVFNFL